MRVYIVKKNVNIIFPLNKLKKKTTKISYLFISIYVQVTKVFGVKNICLKSLVVVVANNYTLTIKVLRRLFFFVSKIFQKSK